MKDEKIVTLGRILRLAYIKVYDDIQNEFGYIDIDDVEYKKLFWRIYWRV